jgi:hypothetical protein
MSHPDVRFPPFERYHSGYELGALESLVNIISEYHSEELRNLTIHQRDGWGVAGNAIVALKTTELSTLATSLTKLEHLEIDGNWKETSEVFDLLHHRLLASVVFPLSISDLRLTLWIGITPITLYMKTSPLLSSSTQL